ncbi:tRNA (adenosine(37)-N6)-threonylcarbamoyltransferase complex dimerization subunit type 1 TsaB [Candidatus Saccharibacteria bacterium]|nr:tRNA (adenosine(37)-N6)-threonylcarbamoyltransferase complex dimerization subunit type 1 TsaB [Candidatus Saccharibacteria bacterium]
MILTIRTDKPESEIGLYAADGSIIQCKSWSAHRQLAETLHTEISELLKQVNAGLTDIAAVVVYSGPGSFTGLRIGVSVANAFAQALGVTVSSANGDQWISDGISKASTARVGDYSVPEYGSLPHITVQRK